MITKSGKEQIYFGTFIGRENEDASVEVPYGIGAPLRLSFIFNYGDNSSQAAGMSWTTESGVIKFKLYNMVKGAIGITAVPLVELGKLGDRSIFIEVVSAGAGADQQQISVFLYAGGANA